ncbi:DUF3540 domain-containing protein [Desulfonatronum sp. SC1]|uniref:DUF3540 domain-containing protein n=1 Tax=Desulfonatronum sp. SC1 TaxID=2109626 RepID=UPI000D323CF7|nr:DUF3540 domain-containing protein [Desulfonatronum sp. SC1]PTN36717.1 hypothetical protein C6366_08700 [Desulfonatronum sp. SC1]
MPQAARKIESAQPVLEYATVENRSGEGFVVCTAYGRMQAQRAKSCLLMPDQGDQILLSVDRFGRAYVLAVLVRGDADTVNRLSFNGPTRLEISDGDMSLSAQAGITLNSPTQVSMTAPELNIHAAQAEIGLEETHFTGKSFSANIERIRTMARNVDSFMHHLVQRMTSSFRQVREHDETQAASARQLVQGTLTVQTGNSVHTAEGHVKIDAEQIHLG